MRKRSLSWAMALAILLAFFVPVAGPVEAQAPADSVDVILIVDTSGSMRDNDPEAIRISAAKLFVDLSGEGDRVAIINMSDSAHTKVITELTKISTWLDATQYGRRAIKESLDTLAEPIGQATMMGTSLSLAYDVLDRTAPGRRQYIVMLTDGKPTGESPTVLTEAIEAFERKRFWKIFPIALGEGADFDFLQREVAGRTGGKAFKASTAAELIRVYTEIFALLRYNRYVNWVTVEPNVLQTLATITAEQRVTDLALVVPKEGDEPFIDVLLSPTEVNIVDPAYAAGVYHAVDPRYEVYVIGEKSIPLAGEWRARLLSGESVEMAILVRSDFGIQLFTPSPQASWDELSERYHPQGEPLFVQVGVRNTSIPVAGGYEPRSPQGSLELYLAPMVRMSFPPWDPVTLRDDGLQYDLEKDDGRYTGIYGKAETEGDYLLEIEVPSRREHPLRLVKSRVIQVKPLPILFLQLPPFEKLRREVPITLGFQQPAEGPVPITSAEISLVIKEPGGKVYSMEPVPSGDQYTALLTVSGVGKYEVCADALVRVNYAGRDISYASFARGTYGVPVPSITVKPQETDLGEMRELTGAQVTVELTSESIDSETVAVRVEELPGGSVNPSIVEVPPGQTAIFTLNVGCSILTKAGPGQFRLIFTSPEGSAEIVDGEIAYTYAIFHTIEVYAQETDLGQIDDLQGILVTVKIKSDSLEEQLLEARVEGLEDGTVFPQTIKVPPKEETPFTFNIGASGPGEGPPGKFKLILESPQGSVTVINGEIIYGYSLRAGGGYTCLLIPVIGLVILVGAFLGIRRLRRGR